MSDVASHTYHSAREAPVHQFEVPMDGVTEGRLEIRGGTAELRVKGAPGSKDLLRSRFTGMEPRISAAGGRVTVQARFGLQEVLGALFGIGEPQLGPDPLDEWLRSFFGGTRSQGEILLTDQVPWYVTLTGGARDLELDLRGLNLIGLELRGGAAGMVVELPEPKGLVPVRLRGGAAAITFRRPKGTAARVEVTGGMARFRFDHQELGGVGGRTRLESGNFATASDRYELDIAGGASDLVVEESP